MTVTFGSASQLAYTSLFYMLPATSHQVQLPDNSAYQDLGVKFIIFEKKKLNAKGF